ncbi:hypothetical protein HN51_011677 [Arachis hypogaea]
MSNADTCLQRFPIKYGLSGMGSRSPRLEKQLAFRRTWRQYCPFGPGPLTQAVGPRTEYDSSQRYQPQANQQATSRVGSRMDKRERLFGR